MYLLNEIVGAGSKKQVLIALLAIRRESHDGGFHSQ